MHSQLALQRLSQYVVATLASEDVDASAYFEEGARFSQSEYRRYALVAKTYDGSMATFKFALLYPFETRHGAPTGFSLGDVVQVQARLPDGSIISRFV